MDDSVPRLLLIVPAITPSATIYIIKPLQQLAQQGKIRFRTAIEVWVSAAEIRAADIVLFCRNIEPEQDWILQECLARHIPTVYDLDDNLWEVPPGFEYSEHHRAPHRIAQMERYLRKVDLVRVYSHPLEERCRSYNPNVTYVRPCIDLRHMPVEPAPRKGDTIRITYVTGRGSVDPLVNLFAGDLQRLLDEHPGRFEFTWWGEAPERFRDHPDCRVVKVLYDYDQFMQYLAAEGFDIGLAPLTPTSFNLSKTNTKFRDYGACHIAGIYSAVDVYTGCVEPEKTGLLVPQAPGAWYDAILRLAGDAALRETIRRSAYQEINAHYRQEQAEAQWLETIRDLLANRPRPTPAPPEAVIDDPACLASLPPDSLDSLVLDRALDELEDPTAALAQAYRAVRPGGQLALYAAYRQAPARLDESSPRQWSPEPAPVYTRQDNLGGMDAAPQSVPPGLDLRCWEIEFFYRPAARLKRESERRQARRADPQVCDALLYRCQVVKPPVKPPQGGEALPRTWIEPPSVTARREVEQVQELKGALHQAYAGLAEARHRSSELDLEMERCQAETSRQLTLARQMAHEVDAYRNRRLLRWLEALVDRTNFIHYQPPAVQRWADDSLLFGGPLSGFRLRPSLSLTRLPALEYTLHLPRPGLKHLSLMPLFELYPRQGTLHLQIGVEGRWLADVDFPAAQIRAETPVQFNFAPLPAGQVALRLSAHDLDVPLRFYEWQRPTRLGLGKPLARPFVGLAFSDTQ